MTSAGTEPLATDPTSEEKPRTGPGAGPGAAVRPDDGGAEGGKMLPGLQLGEGVHQPAVRPEALVLRGGQGDEARVLEQEARPARAQVGRRLHMRRRFCL